MEFNAGSTLSPVIKIINNTDSELTNVILSYEGFEETSIKISSLSTNSEVITTINTSSVNDSTNLILGYDYNNTHVQRIVYPNLLTNSLIKLTLEINEMNGEHNIVSIIEKDPVDNPIALVKVNDKTALKIVSITGVAALGAFILYKIKNKRNV